ncbi:response regulator, partial [Myxococcota bacterium]|nr:response regulator [Myxococcota bacterium]
NYQMLFNEMLDGVALHEIILNDEGRPVNYRFLAVNPAFERLTGLSAQSIIGRTVLDVMPGTEPFWIETYGEVALTGKPAQFENYSGELGRHFHVSAFRPIKNQFACIFEDISERKEIEERLRQSQKMESIGYLAGGIAHDFNNLLSPIIGMSELLMEDLPKEGSLHEFASDILSAGQRGRDLVNQIMAFSRLSEPKKESVPLGEVIQEVLRLCRSTIPMDIEIIQQIEASGCRVMGDRTHLHQVAMNLVTNAYHAVEENGGSITVTLNKIVGSDDHPQEQRFAGDYILFDVSDTGNGIAPQFIGKVFDPYFTTREHGKGTGLGLAVVYGIVKELKGEIRVSSEMGKGSSFTVCLPALKDDPSTGKSEPRPNLPRGTERILLVDDERSIIRVESQMLERLGYSVVACSSGTEALVAFRADPSMFDLVLTDMAMPNMTGEQLASEIRTLKVDVPVIICTGYSEKINQERASSLGIELLMKPLELAVLAQKVRDLLDTRQ